MDTKQIVAALESGSLEDKKTVESMAEAARLIIAQQARIEQLTNCAKDVINAGNFTEAKNSIRVLNSCIRSGDDLTALRAHDAGIWSEAAAACETLLVAYDRRETDAFPDALDCKRILLDRAAAIEKGGV